MFIWDSHGLVSYRKLLQAQQTMNGQYEKLEKHQRELLALAKHIRSDPKYITIEARGLGYYQKEDRLILINTWTQAQPAPSPGEQLTLDKKIMEANTPSGIWLYALFFTACLWLIVRLLYFGQPDRIPRGFNLNRRGKLPKEKFPKIRYAKTVRQSRKARRLSNSQPENPENIKDLYPKEIKQIYNESPLDSIYYRADIWGRRTLAPHSE